MTTKTHTTPNVLRDRKEGTMPSTTTVVVNRGEGTVYRGSMTELVGSVVAELTECECGSCAHIAPWDRGRFSVRLVGGVRLEHVRWESIHDA